MANGYDEKYIKKLSKHKQKQLVSRLCNDKYSRLFQIWVRLYVYKIKFYIDY